MSDEVKDIQTESASATQTSSYRSIFKATSLFGGVQVYVILIQIIKSKIVAVLLGPLGVGIQGLYQSALDLIKQITSLGISQSAVRDVAEAHGSGDYKKISRIVTVLRKIVWGTGLLGLLAVLCFSPLLSKASFGDYKYIVAFLFLAIIPLLDQLSAGQKVILQGTRRLKDLAKASAIGATAVLAVSAPLYYFFGTKGIVPTIILSAIVALLASWYYSRKVSVDKVQVSFKEVIAEGKSMMVMGISMSITGIMTMGTAFVIRSLIRQWGGTEEVGLFQAGFVMINSYVGLVFNAMTTDYFPRLAAANKDNDKCKDVVSKQGEISVFLLAPLLTICIVAMPLVIRILYSEQFLPVDGFIKWCCIGMMFRLSSWLMSFMFVAKAESKLFVLNETIANVNYLWMSLIGYRVGGLSGMGVAFTVSYLFYTILLFIIARKRYDFSLSKDFCKEFFIQLVLVILCFCCIMLLPTPINYILGSFFAGISLVISLRGLSNKIDLKSAFQQIKSRNKK